MRSILFLLIHRVTYINAISNASNTEITTPINGLPQNSSILDTTKSSFVITAKDANGNPAGDSELFWAELNKADTCEVGYGSMSCEILCYPFNEPHITAKQCESSYYTKGRVTKTSDTGLWVIPNIESSALSTYTITYHESVEVSDNYIVTIYLLINGGLYGRYWDNIWFTGTESYSEIASEINYQWGTDAAITVYGTDYISARWEGKILAPYNETYRFYLYADDGSRLWIDKQMIINGWDECCNETWASVNLTANTFHDIIIEYKEIRAEAYIELRWSSDSISKSIVPSTYLYYQQHIKNSPFDASPIYISPGNVSYQQTVVNDQAPFLNNIAGLNNSVYLTATDAFGHVLNTDTAIFNITNLNGIPSIQEWQGNGIYKITFMSFAKTTNFGKQFSIELNNNNILNSPYTVYVEPSDTSSLNSTLSGPGLVNAVAGYSAKFNITLYDIYGNERESDGDIITVRFYGAAAGHATCQYSTSGTAAGTYLCSYTLTQTGIYTPEVTINNIVLPYSSTINVSAGIIHAPSCNIINIQHLNTTLYAGYIQYITIQSRDQFGNPLITVSDNYIVNISNGITIINSSISSIGSGQYNLTFMPLITGIYDVNILLNNATNIFNSPYTLTVVPGDPVASTSYLADTHNSATSNVETYFIIQLRDLYGNTIINDPNNNNTLTALLLCSLYSINTTISCNYYINGQYKCTYTPIKSGSCLIYVTISNIHITNSPFSIFVEAGEISSTHSYIYDINNGANIYSIAGIIDSSFRIQSQDINGNNLTGGEHTFISKLVDKHNIYPDVAAEITDNMDGSYIINYITQFANVYEELNVQLKNSGGLTAIYYTDYSFTNTYDIQENIIDSIISFDWGYNEPVTKLVTNFPACDYFSIEWFGYLYPPYSETYTIYTNIYAGTGIQLYVNNELLIDEFDPLDGESDPFIIIQLTANTFYDIIIKFREQTGQSKISLEWQSATITNRIPIQSQYLYYIADIGNSNISVIPSDSLATSSTVINMQNTVIAGMQNELFIITKDIYNNIQTHAGNEESAFKLYLIDDNNNQINGTVQQQQYDNGEYIATYTITNTSSQYILYMTYNGINVDESPYIINILPGNLSTTQSNAALFNGRAGEFQIFSLFIRDSYSNLIYNRDVSISLILTHMMSGITVTTNNMTYNGDGEYIITYNTTLSGQYDINITLNNTYFLSPSSIDPNPPIINISTAIASSSKSYIIGWSSGVPSTPPISSFANIQKTIQLIDIYSNPISFGDGHGYNFYVVLQNASDNIVNQGIITLAPNGTYFINFTVAAAGIYYLNVLLASGDKGIADGLFGEYFNNRWLYDIPYNTQIDTNVSLNWGNDLITYTAKNFVSIRWTGFIKPLYAETYTFIISSDDGSRLYINKQLIFDHFLSNAGSFNGTYTFNTDNLLYPLRIEYRENTGNANITVQWESSSQSIQIIPQSVLFSSASHIKSSPFTFIVT